MRRVTLFVMIISLFGTSLEAAKESNGNVEVEIYKVKRGESLSLLASRFHTTTKKLIELNRLQKTTLFVGQSIVVPVSPKQKESKKETKFTKIKKQTKKIETKKDEVKKAETKKVQNKEKKALAKKEKKFIKYKVDKGDTLAYIARRFHITKKEVALLNGLDLHKMPKAGKILKLPNYKYWSSQSERLKDLKISSYEKEIKRPAFYVVKSGDTLFSIARKFKTPIKELAKVNKLKSTDLIKEGQKLKIPSQSYSQIAEDETRNDQIKKEKQKNKTLAKKETKNIYYTIKKGDTIERIARKTKIPLKRLLKLNHITTETKLYIGKKILLAKKSVDSTSIQESVKTVTKKVPKKYVVRSGDTLWGIAKKHKISVAKLRKLNHLSRRSTLLDGMVLVVGYDKKSIKIKEKISKNIAKKEEKKKLKLAKKVTKSKEKKKLVASIKHPKKKAKRVAKKSDGLDVILMTHKKKSKMVSANKIIRIAKKYLGTRYVWGAEGPKGFDCSGFTQYVMKKSKGITIPRVSRRQAYYGKYVSRKDLQPGDLIFFDTSKRRRGYVNHVGIYIGNNKFIHASSAKHRVVITSLNRPFYRARFKWGRRIN